MSYCGVWRGFEHPILAIENILRTTMGWVKIVPSDAGQALGGAENPRAALFLFIPHYHHYAGHQDAHHVSNHP